MHFQNRFAKDKEDMDASYSNVNEVLYPNSVKRGETEVQFDNQNNWREVETYLPPEYPPPHSYQSHLQSFHHQTNTNNNQSPVYDYHITNDHQGQYILKRQNLPTNLISSNERYY